MRYQPWLRSPDWEKRDFKLAEAQGQPLYLPHTQQLVKALDPRPPGIVLLRGPRQIGKSTFLRQFAARCLNQGIAPENIVLFDAERFTDRHHLLGEMEAFIEEQSGYTVLLIDEITALDEWWLALKVLADSGKASNSLLLGTGSSAVDLHAGADRLPGRRGRRHPVDFELLPIPYSMVKDRLRFEEFLLTGGFPWSINEYLRLKAIPSHVFEIHAAAIQGAFQKENHRGHLLNHILPYLAEHQGTPTSVLKLSRDCGVGSNRTAEEYLALLEQIFMVVSCYWTDPHGGPPAPRKNRKFYALDPFLFHLFSDFGKGWEFSFAAAQNRTQDPAIVGRMVEGIVATELRRQNKGPRLSYWLGAREIDFVGDSLIEVKYRNHVSVEEFDWAEKVIPVGKELLVLTRKDSAVKGRVRLMPLDKWIG